jgi:hypothetical protein
MCPMDDLYQALSMFKQGASDLATARAISGANEQVEQIKSSELDEQAKRAALTDVSHQLVSHMMMTGAPVERAQAAAGAFAPKTFANANAMNAEAVLTGDPSLAAQAMQQRDFETNPKFELAKLKAQHSPLDDAYKAAKFKEVEDAHTEGWMQKAFKEANPATSSRSTMARLMQNLAKVKEVGTLSSDPTIARQQLEELPRVVDSLLSGGTGTVGGTEHMRPNGLMLDYAKLKDTITSSPHAVNMPETQKMYGDTIDRIGSVAQNVIRNQMKSALKAEGTKAAMRDPEGFKARAAALMQQVGGDTVDSIDKKTGKIMFASDTAEENLRSQLHAMADQALKTNDPRIKDALARASDLPEFYGAITGDAQLEKKIKGLKKRFQ